MLSDFNKSNPFIIILKNKSEEFTRQSISLMSDYTRSIIINILLSILPLLFGRTLFFWVPMLYTALGLLLTLKYILSIQISEEKAKINEILYSNKYKIVNVNNEEVLTIIEKINNLIGQTQSVKNSIIQSIIMTVLITAMTIISSQYLF